MEMVYVALVAGKFDKDGLFRYVISHNPDVKPENIQSMVAMNNYDLLINFKDGNRILFDTTDNTRRYMPWETDALTEEQHRKIFPQLLNIWMIRRGMTEDEMAERLGISQPMVSKYLTGKALPGYVRLKNMATILHCTVEDLYLNY